jgi:hypothetical protein
VNVLHGRKFRPPFEMLNAALTCADGLFVRRLDVAVAAGAGLGPQGPDLEQADRRAPLVGLQGDVAHRAHVARGLRPGAIAVMMRASGSSNPPCSSSV